MPRTCWPLILVVVLVAAACNHQPTGLPVTPTPTAPPVVIGTPPPSQAQATGKPILASGAAKTGLSKAFKLTAGTYSVAWIVDNATPSCALYLFLTTKLDGPTIAEIESAVLPSVKTYSGTASMTVSVGTYVMQEDHSGLVSCTAPWSATITPG